MHASILCLTGCGGLSVQGLRTLVLASRILDNEEWAHWNKGYQGAAASLEGREARIAAEARKVETDLQLIGVTAIEDKLQDGVPEAIQTLVTAGIKVRAPCHALPEKSQPLKHPSVCPCCVRVPPEWVMRPRHLEEIAVSVAT